MIGIILISHGKLAHEFVCALEHILGPQENIQAIGILNDDDIDARRNELLDAVKTADQGEGVVLLTDLFGGTPSNLALSVISTPNVEVVAGVNLPMLVKLVSLRGKVELVDAVTQAQEAGRRQINVASSLLAATA